MRYPALSGFSVRSAREVPDNCARCGEADELFVGDVGISPALSAEQCGEIFQQVVAAVAELISDEPNADELLRDRTFARALH